MTDYEFNAQLNNLPTYNLNTELSDLPQFTANFVLEKKPSKTSELTNDGDGTSPFATISYISSHGDKNYVYEQGTSSSEWTVTHNLNKYPSITVVDSSGDEVLCDIQYIDENSCKLFFTAAFKGKAYFN